MPEDVALEHHTAYVAYQTAKDKYKAATQGRGTDPSEIRKRAEERLRLAKSRSFCAVCKRKGHWHLPDEGQESGAAGRPERQVGKRVPVHMVYMVNPRTAAPRTGRRGTAPTTSVAPGTLWMARRRPRPRPRTAPTTSAAPGTL